jgi:ring-1,2-phenylacetyl-CoA epoxidase subunit PaaD
MVMNLNQNIPNNILEALKDVYDPEIPVLSLLDIGVIRDIEVVDDKVMIKITPTYSGCPAMDTMADDIRLAIENLGYSIDIERILSPPWNTDWITIEGRKSLEEYGIAAPLDEKLDKMALLEGAKVVKCTLCGSKNTKLVSQFGSTACKALFQCEDCLEPFDYFKCLK